MLPDTQPNLAEPLTTTPEHEAAEGAPPDDGATSPAAAGLSPAETAQRLAELFPALFGGPPRPIKLRIQADIQARAPGVFTRRVLSFFLSRHTSTTAYLRALVAATQRQDLDGQPAGDIAAEHHQAAVDELARRKQIVDARRAAERAARGPLARRQPAADAVATGNPSPRDRLGPSGAPARSRADPSHRADRGHDAPRQRAERPASGGRPPHPGGDRHDRPHRHQAAALSAGAGFARAPDRRPPGDSAPRATDAALPTDPAQRERALMLRAWETSPLNVANFCALKRLSEADFDTLIEQARLEREAMRRAA